ncbi:MAG: efflux RND transporter permease subunit, partial [Planctomycetaceae bacterium]|nr:efflux RND transporter permease subunit [Planctomycetaceae bacterium]
MSETKFSLTQVAVNRPITTLMMSCVVLLVGAISLNGLSVDLMPDLSYPTLSVVTIYPGAGPEEIETLLTRPIEQSLASVTGVEQLTSESMEGSSTVRVRFTWGTNLDAAVDDIRQQLDKLRNSLPETIEAPYVRKYDTADSPILLMGVQSDLSAARLTTLAEQVILPRLEQLDGVARVALRGREERVIHVELDRGRLQARGIGVNQVLEGIRSGNVTQPAGDVRQGNTNVLVRNRGEFNNLEDLRNAVISHEADAIVRVRDVAEVVDGLKEKTELTRVNGQPALMIYVFKQAGANTVLVSDQVHQTVEELNQELTDAIVTIRQDNADFIRESISNIQLSAAWGMGLATIVLILFLHNLTSTLMIAIVMPFSVIATFVLMYFQGFTLNIISFGGLALGIGLLVDNSIVVIESIFRYREEGCSSRDAAIRGTSEVAGAITASTLTTLIVFFPLLFIQGMTGLLLNQLAWVVSFSLSCSLLASLTITPVMAAYWLRSNSTQSAGTTTTTRFHWNPLFWFHQFNRIVIHGLESAYAFLLRLTLRFAFPTLCLLCLIASASVGLYPLIDAELLPKTDEGSITVTMSMAPGINLDQLNAQAIEAEHRIMENTPELVTIAGFIGGDADDSDRWNRAYFRVRLVPRNERKESSEQIRTRIESALVGLPGCRVS